MNSGPTLCPSADELLQLEHDSLDPRQREDLELHIEHCPACRSQLQLAATSCCRSLPPELLHSLGSNSNTTPPRADQEIAGCQLQKPLGTGAASVVWLALEISTGREIALKLIPANSSRRHQLRDRWQSEVAIAARMRHPNLVRLYRVEETPDYFALVFEYVPGETLAKRLHRELPSPAVAARLVRILAAAVNSMHEQQVLHLDLKPSNILLDYSRGDAWELAVPRISDFGISATPAAAGFSPQSRGRLPGCGTPPWTAPEQLLLAPDALTPAADVHGLGSLLYALLTGQPPLPPVADNQLLETVLHQLPAAPELLQPSLPPQLSRICLRCLEKHPTDRYQSATELATALDEWITNNTAPRSFILRGPKLRIVAPVAISLVLAASVITQHAQNFPKQPSGSNSLALPSTTASPPPQTTSADFFSLLATPADALDATSAQHIATTAAQHTKLLLEQEPPNTAELLRIGLLLQRAGERMNSSFYEPLYRAAADVLRNSERLLERAHHAESGDQRVLQELAAVRFCLGNLKTPRSAGVNAADFQNLREQIRNLRQCAIVAAQMTDHRQQVYWLGQVLDAGRSRSLHSQWAGNQDLADEIRREITAVLPVNTPAARSADIHFRILLWQPSVNSRFASVPHDRPEEWAFANSILPLKLEAVCNLIATNLFSCSKQGKFTTATAQQCLAEAQQLLDQLGLETQRLPQIMNTELVRPVAAISSECRVLNQLDQAEYIQHAWLLLCTEAHQMFPDHPEIHLALSEVHLQAWKNFLRRDRDDDAVAALKQSLSSAEAAWQAAPESAVAYRQIADRIQRLERFNSERRKAVAK